MSSAAVTTHKSRSWADRFLRGVLRGFLWLVVALFALWAFAALYIDVRIPPARLPLAILFAVAIIAIVWRYRLHMRGAILCLLCVCVVLIWWLNLKPTNQADWQEDVSRRSSTEVHGDQLTIHNFRNCDYVSEFVYSNCWSDKTLKLSDLRGMDLFFTTWGAPGIGHPIVSFDFGNGQHVAFSIEARYRKGQDYSAFLGFFRQYELIFVVADERDVIRLRTNFRKDEEVFLYRINLDAAVTRRIFDTYTHYLNALNDNPEWYNALTKNCTTTVDGQIMKEIPNQQAWNYQLLLNGTLDHLLYNRGRLVTDGLPFAELKQRAHINVAAKAADGSPDYSSLIRAGRPGFTN